MLLSLEDVVGQSYLEGKVGVLFQDEKEGQEGTNTSTDERKDLG